MPGNLEETPGAQPDTPPGDLGDVSHDPVAMLRARRQRRKDQECWLAQGQLSHASGIYRLTEYSQTGNQPVLRARLGATCGESPGCLG